MSENMNANTFETKSNLWSTALMAGLASFVMQSGKVDAQVVDIQSYVQTKTEKTAMSSTFIIDGFRYTHDLNGAALPGAETEKIYTNSQVYSIPGLLSDELSNGTAKKETPAVLGCKNGPNDVGEFFISIDTNSYLPSGVNLVQYKTPNEFKIIQTGLSIYDLQPGDIESLVSGKANSNIPIPISEILKSENHQGGNLIFLPIYDDQGIYLGYTPIGTIINRNYETGSVKVMSAADGLPFEITPDLEIKRLDPDVCYTNEFSP
jgi:hypothetical protein